MMAAGAFAVGLALLMAAALLVGVVVLSANRIPNGVAVSGVNIGGESPDAARQTLQQALGALTVTATDGDRQWPLTFGDLGVNIDFDTTLAAATSAQPGAQLSPFYTIDLNVAQTGLIALGQQANIAAVPGETPQIGRAIDIPQVLERLHVDVSGELADGLLPLNMIEIQPPAYEPPAAAYSGPTTKTIVEAGQELGLIAKAYNVSMEDIVALNGITNPNLLYVGQELTIPTAGLYEPTAANAPAAPTAAGKSILISLGNQRIYAYENGALVHSHLASTGLPATPTVQGDYKIYVKYLADDMSGPGYYLPQVPYTMYFYQGYGIHGTYWHNAFGRPMSHGCVNLPTEEAKWFYDWASVGTPVRVIA